MFRNLLKLMVPLSKYNVLKIKVIFGTLNKNMSYGNPAVQTKVSICDTVWVNEIDKAVDRFG